ncbi:MAG: hypothetical protein HZB25_04580, partial [Candidatus Eisenbacteria bacterium]|nr:hypothetical protein [Candidatus Eisenbacteria bacterium]
MSANRALRGAIALAAVTVLLMVSRAPARAGDYAGANGKFTTSTSTDPFTGVKEIKITYYPDPKKVGKCSSIYLVQTVRRTDQNGDVIQPKDLDAGRFKHAQDDMTAGGTCVDHLSTERDPYYNGEDADKDTQSKGSTDASPDATATEMVDGPHYLDGTFPAGVTEATLTFETCAVCKDTGKILDCVTWTYHRTKGEAGTGTLTEPAAAAPPTQEFKDAKAKFEKNHANGLICPEGIAEFFEGLRNAMSGFFSYMPPFPHPMQPTQLVVDVVNSSGQPMTGLQWTAFDQHGSRFLGAGTIPAIGPFDYAPVMFTVPPVMDPGTVDYVQFTVDPTNAIPEYDETDNQELIPVGFYGPLGVDDGSRGPVPGRLSVSPSPFRFRTSVAFTLPRAA